MTHHPVDPGADRFRAAPGSDPVDGDLEPLVLGPEELRHERISGRNRWRFGALFALTFLTFYVVGIWGSDSSISEKVVTTVLLGLFGADYVLMPPMVITGGRIAQYRMLGGLLVLTAVLILFGGPSMTGLWVYVGVAAALVLPLAQTIALALALAVLMIVLTAQSPGGVSWELAVTLVALAVWMSAFTRNIRLTAELRLTRGELAKAAVAAERVRIARDLHDILGHSLTGIAVKAGLARRLMDRDPAAATREVADIERLAREALADVRATAAGIRGTSLAGELAAAATMLRAAGIRPVLPQAVDNVAPAGREVFGFVVREAVTNVVRHSGATVCTISLAPGQIEIVDDGSGPGDGVGGRGLLGLAERVEAAGGELLAGPRPEGGFAVVATVGAQ